MKKAWKKVLSFSLAFAVLFSGIPLAAFPAEAAEEAAADTEYEIYPVPHSISYENGTVELGDSANLVIESAIDDATVNHLNDILAIKNISGTASDGMVDGTLNILVGTKGSGGAAENWVNSNVTYADDLFDKVDAYVLSIQDNVIAVLGKDTDAAFYGLSTLKLIFEQAEGSTVRKLKMEDYANGQYRGFIEGYYGLPWSVEDRISLMEFGSRFKMNIYIFAPKDDIYHNKQWNVLYPENKLEDIRRMVEAGQAAKCRFAWAIHPFMHNQITASNYDTSLQTVKDKFQQLYDVGVRQFVISADDASSSPQVQANLCRDMSQWVKEHEGTYNLVFVPQLYNTATGSWYGISLTNYYNYFKADGLEDVEIMWTGESVCAPSVQYTYDNFKRYTNKDAFMWLNWPVNDVNKPLRRLVMGPAESCILNTNVTSFKGIVTNPLQQAEASKTSLFAIADYAWNVAEFDAQTSWADSFKYIDEGAPESLHELCKHLTNPSPDGITGMGESVELTPYINAFTNALNGGQDITESGNALIEQFDKIEAAADDYQKNGTNENLKDEMKAWIDSLRYLSQSVKGFIRAAMAENADTAWSNYITAVNAYKASRNCESPVLLKDSNGDAVTDENGDVVSTQQAVEAGYMKIMPLSQQLNTSSAIKNKVMGLLENSFTSGGGSSGGETGVVTPIYDGIGGVYSEGGITYSASRAIDGDDSTYAWFNQPIAADAYFGVDLGGIYKLDTVRILQGNSDSHTDIFTSGILEYSLDGTKWTDVGGTYGTNRIEVSLLSRSLKARYVRLRNPSATSTWYCIREFQVTTQEVKDYAYTNVESLKETEVTLNPTDASVGNVGEITLAGGEYIGLEFPVIRELTSLTADYTQKDKLALEYSSNGKLWQTVNGAFEGADAKYVRIINKGTEAVSFTLSGITVNNTEADRTIVAEPDGPEGSEAPKAADNSLDTLFRASEGAGSMVWRTDYGLAAKLYILQEPSAASDAKVSVLLSNGTWEEVGALSKGRICYTDMERFGAFSEVKVEWENNGPAIYEIYKIASDKTEKQALDELVAKSEAEEYQENLYEQAVWQEFTQARENAQAVAAKENATEEEIAEAMSVLASAANKIQMLKNADIEAAKAELTDLLNDMQSVAEAGKGSYTDESWSRFEAAYGAASNAASDADAATLRNLCEELKAAYLGLTNEQGGTPLETARKELSSAMQKVKATVEGGQGKYTDASWNALIAAYQAAVHVSADAGVEELEKLTADLNAAFGKLELKEEPKPGTDKPGTDKPGTDILKAGDTVTVGAVQYSVLNADKKTAAAVKAAKDTKKLKIADKVTIKGVSCTVVQIKAKAFKGNKKLQTVTIGKNVTTIGKQAFNNCKKLKKVTFRQAKAPKIGGKAFAGISKKVKVKVLKSMKKKQRTKLAKKLKSAGIKKRIKL